MHQYVVIKKANIIITTTIVSCILLKIQYYYGKNISCNIIANPIIRLDEAVGDDIVRYQRRKNKRRRESLQQGPRLIRWHMQEGQTVCVGKKIGVPYCFVSCGIMRDPKFPMMMLLLLLETQMRSSPALSTEMTMTLAVLLL